MSVIGWNIGYLIIYKVVRRILSIPEFNRDDFDSSTPYEYVYDLRDDPFQQMAALDRLSEYAQRKFKVRNIKRRYQEYVEKLKRVNNVVETESVTEYENQPIELSCGMEWTADEYGIVVDGRYGREIACNHPLTITQRLVNIDTGVEKLVLAYRKGKQWRQFIADKKTLASKNSILDLANVGIAVNSENSHLMVRFLHDLESYNYDRIPEKNSVSRLGWIEDEGFSPYVDDLVFDGDASFRNYFDSVKNHGKYDCWKELVRDVRQQSLYARVILAASFASVLVKPLGALSFFVHLWGGTESGKTVGLMLAASVWASPEMGRYIHTFNSTAVGREKSAGFVNSMPLILDELQIMSDKKQFDKDIYMLSEGIGRTRGNKSGGIDKTATWSNCILTSGEMPITNSNSGGGAINRIIEIECKEKLFTNPREVADVCRQNYGFAGEDFIKQLQQPGIVDLAQEMYRDFSVELAKGDTTEKQVMAAALVLTADKLITDHIFLDDHPLGVGMIQEFLKTRASVDVNERAYDYVYDFIIRNKNKFSGESKDAEIWGRIDDAEIAIIRQPFVQICEEGGFNSQSLMSWMRHKKMLRTNGKGFTHPVRINGEPCNCIVITRTFYDENCEELPKNIPDV